MRFVEPVHVVLVMIAMASCQQEKREVAKDEVAGQASQATGVSTTWHLQEHSVAVKGNVGSVIADCRGNNFLSWEVRDTTTFIQPKKVGVYCGMYATPPPFPRFEGWGETKTNWAQLDGCTSATADKFGERSCSDYHRAVRDSRPVSAPWCKITFSYAEPVTTAYTIVTYCVTR